MVTEKIDVMRPIMEHVDKCERLPEYICEECREGHCKKCDGRMYYVDGKKICHACYDKLYKVAEL